RVHARSPSLRNSAAEATRRPLTVARSQRTSSHRSTARGRPLRDSAREASPRAATAAIRLKPRPRDAPVTMYSTMPRSAGEPRRQRQRIVALDEADLALVEPLREQGRDGVLDRERPPRIVGAEKHVLRSHQPPKRGDRFVARV